MNNEASLALVRLGIGNETIQGCEAVDWEAIEAIVEKHHMKEIFDSVNAICEEYLGFDCIPLTVYSLRSDSDEGVWPFLWHTDHTDGTDAFAGAN